MSRLITCTRSIASNCGVKRNALFSTHIMSTIMRTTKNCLITNLNSPNSSDLKYYYLMHNRKLSYDSNHSNNNMNLKAFPSHLIFGEQCVLQMKPIMPKFRTTGQHGNAIAVSQQGKMMFQFHPSIQSGIQWQNGISMALSPEELGLLINQLPVHPVTFTRILSSGGGDGMDGQRYDMISDDNSVVKTMTAIPIEGAAIQFKIDYMKNGIGGQAPPLHTNERNYEYAPLEIVVQAGEWEVLRIIAQNSITALVGWESCMEIALNDALVNRSH